MGSESCFLEGREQDFQRSGLLKLCPTFTMAQGDCFSIGKQNMETHILCVWIVRESGTQGVAYALDQGRGPVANVCTPHPPMGLAGQPRGHRIRLANPASEACLLRAPPAQGPLAQLSHLRLPSLCLPSPPGPAASALGIRMYSSKPWGTGWQEATVTSGSYS